MISRRLLRIKVLKQVYGYVSGNGSSLPTAEKELQLSINKTFEQYKYLFFFVPLLRNYSEKKIETGKQKYLPTEEEKNPNTKFINNKLILQIANNKDLLKFAEKNSVLFADAISHVIGKMYCNMAEKEYFLEYMNSPETSFDQDKKLVVNIFENEFEDFHDLFSLLEEQSIYWTDEPEFVVSNIIKTVKTIKEGKDFKLLDLYKNEDDEMFAQKLFRHAIVNYDKYNKLIDENAPNWDVERIALMDSLILIIAASECVEFPNIPIKVTLDEYIDLARFYSTSSSSVFVNGLLDKMIEHFETNNLLNKQGRGLI